MPKAKKKGISASNFSNRWKGIPMPKSGVRPNVMGNGKTPAGNMGSNMGPAPKAKQSKQK